MMVSDRRLAILDAFLEICPEGFQPTSMVLLTHEIREHLDGVDPHPTLGLMVGQGLLWKVMPRMYGLTELGEALCYVGHLERQNI